MVSVYKYVSLVLLILFLLAGGAFLWEKKQHEKSIAEYSNEVAKLEGIVKETETAISKRAVEINNLKSDNKQLQKAIKDRDSEILALGEATIKWKDKYFQIKDAKQTVVSDGTVISEQCKEQLLHTRTRVEFDQQKDYLRIYGFTLSNPPEAELFLEFIRPLKLKFILTKDKGNKFRLYLDPQTSDVETSDLSLSVDPSVLELSWYEKISLGLDLGVGSGVATGLGIGYQIDNFVVGPKFFMFHDGNTTHKLYGGSLMWFMFR